MIATQLQMNATQLQIIATKPYILFLPWDKVDLYFFLKEALTQKFIKLRHIIVYRGGQF